MVLVVDAWMVEHQAHHAYTNEGGLDPDTAWFAPAFNYLEVARQGGSRRVGLLASGLYPLLVPIMLLKSLAHLVKTRGWVSSRMGRVRNIYHVFNFLKSIVRKATATPTYSPHPLLNNRSIRP